MDNRTTTNNKEYMPFTEWYVVLLVLAWLVWGVLFAVGRYYYWDVFDVPAWITIVGFLAAMILVVVPGWLSWLFGHRMAWRLFLPKSDATKADRRKASKIAWRWRGSVSRIFKPRKRPDGMICFPAIERFEMETDERHLRRLTMVLLMPGKVVFTKEELTMVASKGTMASVLDVDSAELAWFRGNRAAYHIIPEDVTKR